MYISPKNTARGRFFILCFPANDNSADVIIEDLQSYAQLMPESLRNDFENILNIIRERLTDKYAQEPGEMSSLLFDNEIACFLSYFMIWSAVKKY